MKKVINGLLYDTGMAEKLYEKSIQIEDTLDWFPVYSIKTEITESLFYTQAGNYFVFNKTTMTRKKGFWPKSNKKEIETIIPKSPSEARVWLEKNDAPTDLILEFFDEVELA